MNKLNILLLIIIILNMFEFIGESILQTSVSIMPIMTIILLSIYLIKDADHEGDEKWNKKKGKI